MMMEQSIPNQKKQEKNKKRKQKIIIILKGIVTVLIVTMSILHFPFERYSKEQRIHLKKYTPLVKNRNQRQDSLKSILGITINIAQYKMLSKKLWDEDQKKLKEFTKENKRLKQEHSFLGRSNFKFWFFLFGLVSLGFYFSIRSLFVDYRKRVKSGHIFISSLGVSISLFWYYHLFFKTASDFYDSTYVWYEVIICLVTALFISKLVKYYAEKENVIKSLMNLIFKIKKIHFRKMTIKALYAERNNSSVYSIERVKDCADEFDRDIKETIERL